MFCKNCGTKLDDGIVFCPNCGKPISATKPAPQPEPHKAEQPVPQSAVQPTPQPQSTSQQSGEPKVKKPLDKRVLIGIIAVVAIIVAFVTIKMMPKKYDIEGYIKIEFNGYNGYGHASARLDYEKLYTDILKDKGLDKKMENIEDIDSLDDLGNLGGAIKDGVKIEQAIDSIELKLDKEYDSLKNGDEVKVNITYDEKAVKAAGIRFKGSSVTKKVEGLKTVEEKDPFVDLVVKFSGTAPNGYLEMEYLGTLENVSTYSFAADKYDGLSNGDVVTIRFGADDEDPLAYGFAPKVRSMEFTVEGLDEYVAHFSDISEDFLNSLKREAEDTIVSYVANSYSKDVKVKNLTYAGYIMSTLKEEKYGTQNRVFLIYKGVVSHSDKAFKSSDIYYPVEFNEVMNASGTFSYSGTPYIMGSCNLGNYYLNGYLNPVSAYMDIVAENANDYDSESGDGFEKYQDYEFVGSLSEISEDAKSEMIEAAKDVVKQYVKDEYCMKSVKNLSAVGGYLLKAKDTGDYKNQSIYVVVLSGNVVSENGEFKKMKVFYPIVFKGIVKFGDGSGTYLVDDGITGYSDIPDTYYNTKGYLDGETMYDELISANRGEYTYEVSDELKEFGQ